MGHILPPVGSIPTVTAGREVGIREIYDAIWLVSFVQCYLGHIDLEQRTLRPSTTRWAPGCSQWFRYGFQWPLVPGEGLEPSRPCGQRILSPLRLPISPTGHVVAVFILWRMLGRVTAEAVTGQPSAIGCSRHGPATFCGRKPCFRVG